MSVEFALDDLAATQGLAARMAGVLTAPFVVGLRGEIGAGKTTLVRALIQTLLPGVRVKSPTYTLLESYDLPDSVLHHFDLYRLRMPEELDELGIEDLFATPALFLIEWPERGGSKTPACDWDVQVEHKGPTCRRLSIEARSEPGRHAIERLQGVNDQSVSE